MSRPQKIHKPIKGGFNNILASIAGGTGKAKRTAILTDDKRSKTARKPVNTGRGSK